MVLGGVPFLSRGIILGFSLIETPLLGLEEWALDVEGREKRKKEEWWKVKSCDSKENMPFFETEVKFPLNLNFFEWVELNSVRVGEMCRSRGRKKAEYLKHSTQKYLFRTIQSPKFDPNQKCGQISPFPVRLSRYILYSSYGRSRLPLPIQILTLRPNAE